MSRQRLPLLLLVLAWIAASLSAQASVSIDASQVEVGEPFQLVLELDDPSAVDPGSPELDDSWVLLDEHALAIPGGMRFTWRVASLEPGSRLISFLPGVDLAVAPEAVRMRVTGVLRADETEPRPLPGLPADFGASLVTDHARPAWQYVLAGISAGLVLALLIFVLWNRRRRGPEAQALPSVIERFDAQVEAEVEVSARHHLWAQLLREAVDRRAGRQRVALTEEEWLQAISSVGVLSVDLLDGIKQALDKCERVRFAGARPSSFAAQESQHQVRALLVEVGRLQPLSKDGGQAA